MTTIKEEAQNLLDSREAVYGDRKSNMENVAKIFSGILGTEVRADQVPLLMIGYKTFRASQTPDYEDNVKDIEGYAIMFREVIGDDMIAAVNTDEYLLEKSRREMTEMEAPSIPAEYCPDCERTMPIGTEHSMRCKVNRNARAYNSRYAEELPLPKPTEAQAARLLKEVPSYQPGPGAEHGHLWAYRQQLTDIFRRAWKAQGPTVPVEKFAEIAAREAVEYFWLTFLRNEKFEASVKEFPAL